ncbi:MAG: prepilin-type N-terminal cleavage/methylation domain-containing protein [Actinomycetota bacterium]
MGAESGYSLVEVMVAIMLLSLAIIPMVGMFDAGLKAAVLGGNYDKARALANEKLEETRAMSYPQVRARYAPPGGTCSGTVTPGFACEVATTYVNANLDPDPTARTRMRIDVTVRWDGGSKSFTTTGLVTAGTP